MNHKPQNKHKRFFSKRAMTIGFLVAIMITLVSFALISTTMYRFYSKAESKEAEIICHDSIALRAAATIQASGLGTDVRLTPTLCKTIDQKIEGKKAEVMKTVAEKMARCWWMFGEGRYEDILSNSPEFLGFENYENQCFNCYTLMLGEIKDDNGNVADISPEEFLNYISKNEYKGSGQSYTQYIQSAHGPGRVGYIVGNENVDSLKSNHAYAISIVPKLKDADREASAGSAAAKIVGTGIGVFLLASTPVGWTVTAVGLVVAVFTMASGFNDAKVAIYRKNSERDVSSIYLDNLESAQNNCGSTDIAGK
ncbi:hypothetical protein HYU21_04095 [Candidatus Woesearchaeota archaeon]|nr:hypothetical protein [Candidatus Woesearchaeota archaeon]